MLLLWPSSTCLISELARELAAKSARELPEVTVVLPTQRLRVWLFALLAKQRAAYVPPACLTLEEFIRAWTAKLAPTALLEGPLSELAEELLIADLLRGGSYTHLKSGHAHEIRQLFAELTQWDLDAVHAFDRLDELLAANVYLSDGGVDTLSARSGELRDVHRRLGERLRERCVCTAAQALAAASRGLAAALGAGAPLPARPLNVAGLTTAPNMHAALFAALGARPAGDVSIWLSEPPASAKSPLALLVDMFGAAPRPASAAMRPRGTLSVAKATGVLAEVEQAVTLAEQAVAGGMAPSAIALLVTNDAAYAKPLRLLLAGSALSANIALGEPLSGTEIGSWLAALLALLASDEDLASVLSFLTHPLTMAWQRLDDRQERLGGSAWRERVSEALPRLGIEAGLARLAAAPSLDPALREVLAKVLAALGPLTGAPRSLALGAWTEAVGGLVGEVLASERPRGPAATARAKGVALSAKTELLGFLDDVAGAARHLTTPLTRKELRELLGSRLSTLEARSVGEPLAGLQVLSVAEARYVPFELVIVLGAVEGEFPRALPKDHLLDNYLKTKMGLPGWHLLEAIEDQTFLLLRDRLPALILSYPEVVGAEPAVRSRFIEGALAHGEARALRLAARADGVGARLARRARVAPAAAAARTTGDAVLPESDRQRLLAHFSASSLEALVRCPYRFLLQRLGVDETEMVRDDDARLEGDWLHDVLEAFFTGRAGERRLAEPLDPAVPWAEFRVYALARLAQLTAAVAPGGPAAEPVLLQLRLRSWPAFVDHLLRIYGPETLPQALAGWRERALAPGAGETLEIDLGDRRLKLRGAIDAVEVPGGLHVVTDYKRAGTPPKAEVLAGIAPQLLVYAKAVQTLAPELPLSRAVCGYWSILKGSWQAAAVGQEALAEARARGLTTGKDAPALEAAVERFFAHVRWRLGELEVVDAAFRPDPSACGFCRYAGVCRRDDPELGPAVAAAARLAARLAEDGAP